MSDNVIDLLNNDEDVEHKPAVIYSPKIITALNLAWGNSPFSQIKHQSVEFNRFLSSIWQTHPDGYRYINIKGVQIEQRINDADILRTKVTLDIVYRDGQFTVNNAEIEYVDFMPVHNNVFVTYAPASYPVIESLVVDNTHVVVTGCKPPEVKVQSKEIPEMLHAVKVIETRNGKSHHWVFSVEPRNTSILRRISDGSVGLELDNLRIIEEYIDDVNGNPQRIEIGLTGTITFVNGEPIIPEIKLVNPRLTVFKDNDWHRVEKRAGFIGYVDMLYFDKEREVELDMPANYELHPYVWLEGMNHHPEHMGHWVPFNGWRMKDRYDLRLKNGEEHKYYYPNACAWGKFGKHDGPSRVVDEDVAFVRQVPDEECIEEYFFKGKERIKHNLGSFGDAVPDVYVLPDGSVQFKIRHRRLFADSQVVADISPSDLFRHTSTILGHGDFTLTEVLHVPFRVDESLFKAAIRYLKGQLEDKQYSGFSLVEDAKHGYVGSLNGQSFADAEVDWVIRQLIPVAQALPVKPEEKAPKFDPFIHSSIGHTGKVNKNKRVYPSAGALPKKPKNNKALKKAAKKERTRLLKEAKP